MTTGTLDTLIDDVKSLSKKQFLQRYQYQFLVLFMNPDEVGEESYDTTVTKITELKYDPNCCQAFELKPDFGDFVTIGRGRVAGISLPFDTVSRKHAVVNVKGRKNKEYWLADQDSMNGTFYEGVRVGSRAVKLEESASVSFANVSMSVVSPEMLYKRLESMYKKRQQRGD